MQLVEGSYPLVTLSQSGSYTIQNSQNKCGLPPVTITVSWTQNATDGNSKLKQVLSQAGFSVNYILPATIGSK